MKNIFIFINLIKEWDFITYKYFKLNRKIEKKPFGDKNESVQEVPSDNNIPVMP